MLGLLLLFLVHHAGAQSLAASGAVPIVCWSDLALGSGGRLACSPSVSSLFGGTQPLTNMHDIVQIGVGIWALCALSANGTAWCACNSNTANVRYWGPLNTPSACTNFWNGTAVQVHQSMMMATVDHLSVGADAVCMVDQATLLLRCWAAGTTLLPPPTLLNVSIYQVSLGFQSGCVIFNDTRYVACWGVAEGGAVSMQIPQQWSTTEFASVSCGGSVACGITADASLTLVCWGDTTAVSGLPTASGGYTAVHVAMEQTRVCVVDTDAVMDCFGGANSFGENSPPGLVTNPRLPRAFVQVQTAYEFTCGLQADATLQCFGNTPQVPAAFYTGVSLFYDAGCGIRADGRLDCWGAGNVGQLTVPSSLQQPSDIQSVSVGSQHTCVLFFNQTYWCFGLLPQLANNNNNVTLPVPLVDRVQQVSAGSQCTCVLRWNGTVVCWGFNPLDFGLPFPSQPPPTSNLLFATIQLGWQNACGMLLQPPGGVYCFGNQNGFGQLNVPAAVANGSLPVHQLTVGNVHACVLLSSLANNSIVCWGRIAQMQYPNSGPWTMIAAGFEHTCVANATSVLCWKLLATPPPSPAALVSLTVSSNTIVWLGADNYQSCFTTLAGGLVCYGSDGGNLEQVPGRAVTGLAPQAYYRRSAGVEVLACPAGRFSTTPGAMSAQCTGPCAAGTAASTVGACGTVCPAGTYCPQGSAQPQLCPAGTYGVQSGLALPTCTGPCPTGFYCPPGTQAATNHPCPAGRFGNTTGLTNGNCTGACAAGWWCPLGATTAESVACSARGVYCGPGSSSPQPVDPGYYTDAVHAEQWLCPAGSACPGDGNLVPCPAGQFSPATGQAACQVCAVGRVGAGTNQTNCTACPSGSFQNTPGQAACRTCPAGQFNPSTEQSACQLCAPGSVSVHSNQTNCTACPPGSYQDGLGQTTCIACPAGQFNPSAGQAACHPCAVGSATTNISQTACTACAPGSYQDHVRQTGCIPCPPGRYQSGLSGTACDACAAGSATPAFGSSLCPLCAAGTFQPSQGAVECLTCPTGQWAIANGTACMQLVCPPGEEPDAGTRQCAACAPGTFNNLASAQPCSPCPLNTYAPLNGSATCLACPSGGGGVRCQGGQAYANPGYVLYTVDAGTGQVDVLRCAGGPQVCLGNGQCGAHRLADAPLCGTCAPGFSEWGNTCVDCQSPGESGGLLFLALVVSWVLVGLLHRMVQSSASFVTIVAYFVQTALFMVAPLSVSLSWMGALNFDPTSATGPLCVADFSPYQKLAATLLLPAVLMAELAVTVVVHYFVLLNLHIDCCRRLHRAHMFCCARGQRMSAQTLYFRYARTLLAILLLSYTQITSTCFEFLQCVDLEPGVRVVYSQPSISCLDTAYAAWRVLVGFVLSLYVIGLPLGIVVLLVSRRRWLQARMLLQAHHTTRAELSDTRSLPSLKDVVVWSSNPLSTAPAAAEEPSPATTPMPSTTRTTTAPPPPPVVSPLWDITLSLLYSSYRPQTWIWQAVILCRRMLLILVSTLLFQEPSVLYMILALLQLAFALLHQWQQPYVSALHNRLESISLGILLVIAIMLTASPPPLDPGHDTVQVFVLLLVLVPTVIVACWIVYRRCAARRE